MLFRDFIFMKSDLDKIYSENRLKGILYRKYYLNKIEKILNNLRNNPIDINLLKGFYEFLKLTRINLDERFKEKYNVTLYSDMNSIYIIVNSSISFTISVFMEKKITINYRVDNNVFVYELLDNFSNVNSRDREKYKIIKEVNDNITEIIIFSVISYFKKGQ